MQVTYGDFTDLPLDTLCNLTQDVYMPVVCNPRNQEGWPDVVGREVMENLHKFVSNTYVTVGQTQGKTMLPLPPADTTSETSITNMSDKDKVRSFWQLPEGAKPLLIVVVFFACEREEGTA